MSLVLSNQYAFFVNEGFYWNPNEQTLFKKRNAEGKMIIVIIEVDYLPRVFGLAVSKVDG